MHRAVTSQGALGEAGRCLSRVGPGGRHPQAASRFCSGSFLVSALTWGECRWVSPPVYVGCEKTPGNVKKMEGSR